MLHPEIEMQFGLGEKMLPRYLLKPAGYVSAAIGKWHVDGAGFGPQRLMAKGEPAVAPSNKRPDEIRPAFAR